MRIRCMITRSFLTRYLHEELGERSRGFLEAHVEKCDGCRDELRRAADVHDALRSFAVPEVSEGEWDALLSAVVQRVDEGDEAKSPRKAVLPLRRHSGRARYVALAAAVAILVAGAALRLVLAGNQAQQTPITSYIQYHEEAVDGHVLLENHFWNTQVVPASFTP